MNFKKTTAGILLASFAGLSFAQAPTTETQAPAAPAMSAAAQAKAAQYAKHPHLAYIRTGNAAIDEVSLKGLIALKEKMNGLTTIKIGNVSSPDKTDGIVAVDIERDDISLFPMIYWPVNQSSIPLSENAQRKVQKYLLLPTAHLIVFDINNVGKTLGSREYLNRVLGNVTLRRLEKIGEDHSLTKTFFKVAHLRGTQDYTLMVEESGPVGSEIVTSVVIGENNWAAAWAGITIPKKSNGDSEYQMAIRAGVNFVMLAMTGNYKADQALILAKPKEPEKK